MERSKVERDGAGWEGESGAGPCRAAGMHVGMGQSKAGWNGRGPRGVGG